MSSYINLIPAQDVFISEDDVEKIISNNKRFINKFNKYLQQSSNKDEDNKDEATKTSNIKLYHENDVCESSSSDSLELDSDNLSQPPEHYKPKYTKSHDIIQNPNINVPNYSNNPIFNFNIECVVSDKFYRILYNIYKDIIESYNQLKKFKDNYGKLILTPYQLSALLATLLNINEKDISISCEPKIIKKYSDGKILKIHSLKILSSNSKNYDKLINMLTNDFDISTEFINVSDRLMPIRYN